MFMSRFIRVTALALISFSSLAQASSSEVTTRIQSVIAGDSELKAFSSVFSTVDARVYSVATENAVILNQLNAAAASSQPIHLILDGDQIVGVRSISLEERAQFSDAFVATAEETVRSLTAVPSANINLLEDTGYQPTQLATAADAENLFQSLDSNLRHKSQCYQRAHYWAYDMWTRANIKSMKVFLFFTKKYIREYNYKWWFHVAPFVYAGGVETVLDPEFMNHSMEINEWSHNFVKNPETCPVASTYQEYEAGQYDHYCYVRKVSMYFYQPQNTQDADQRGSSRSEWVSNELRNSQCAKRFCWRVGGYPSDSEQLSQ